MSPPLVCSRAGLRVAVAAFASLIVLILAVTQGCTARFDRDVLDAFAALRAPVADKLFLAVTWLGSSYVLVPATLLIMGMLAATRCWPAARLLGLTYFGASLTTWLLKAGIRRERPLLHAPLADIGTSDWALPSGHATHAAAFALGLWLIAARHRPRWAVPAGVLLGALALLVATARLHLQVHWPSDVLAGLLVAVLWAGCASVMGHDGAGRPCDIRPLSSGARR